MKKAVSIALFVLFLYHTLAYVLVCVGLWWQAETDLSKRLLVYRATDSLIEFQIPLVNKSDVHTMARTTSDGFRYHGHFYDVVSLEIRGDTLFMAGLEIKRKQRSSFWQSDLLAFLNDHIKGATDSHRKNNQLLKLLLKEFSPSPRLTFCFRSSNWRDVIRIPEGLSVFSSRSLPIHSPPPEV
ncbi:hypothetical protein GO755_28255 [Spirosoma sp. HMF4905]|uniref:Uncharacterized protein n=1 Tax=Spirosoma arboris TaxID=2682092 RepID=A0A7K1SJH0_9BACT|nr:hypothetical protein [Spirosoma arboris]MVM33961.1 hypothetical protein [Spirosoma arboris]